MFAHDATVSTKKVNQMKSRTRSKEQCGMGEVVGTRCMALLGLTLFMTFALGAAAQNPELTVRFANPVFDCVTGDYCVDVEFQSSALDTEDRELYGKNVRFFYDSSVLQFQAFGDFQGGYSPLGAPTVNTGGPTSGDLFGFAGPATYVNGAVQLNNPSAPPIIISKTGWTKLYNICFMVVNPGDVAIGAFCPSIVWDLEVDPANGGFLTGSNGVVMTAVGTRDATTVFSTLPVDERVEQYNWNYEGDGTSPWGAPDPTVCINTYCPGVAIDKAATLINGGTPLPFEFAAAGDEITYAITVSNTGNVGLTVSVTDPGATAGPTYVLGDLNSDSILDIDEIWVYTATRSATQQDVDNGSFTNTATVTAEDPAGGVTQGSDDVTITANQNPAMIVTKSALPLSYDAAGDVITYTITVANTGNVSISNVVVIDNDVTTGPTYVSGDANSNSILDVGESWDYTATYVISQADLDGGSVLNTAAVSGEDPNGLPVVGDDSETVNADPNAIIANDDAYGPVNGSEGDGNIGNALDNDTLNLVVADITDVTITVVTPATPVSAGDPVPVLDDATGIVSVPPATPEGSYTIVYEICEILNTSNCDTATITVVVSAVDIVAVDDDYTTTPVNGFDGNPSLGNALDNDTLNAVPADIADVTITVITPATPVSVGDPVPSLDVATGVVSVPPATPAGTYTIVYQICEDLNMSNCDTATITVLVSCVEIELAVFLEGAMADPDNPSTYNSLMRADLNDLRMLPGQTYEDVFFGVVYTEPGQPYGVAPWFYSGNEGASYDSLGDQGNGDAGYPATVVDWVLVSLRDTPDGTGGPLCQAAALLHVDGTVEFVDSGLTCCNISANSLYYVVVEHRNHLIAMSHEAVAVVGGKIIYDFRIQQSYLDDPFGFGVAQQKEVLPGTFAMLGGNGQQASEANDDTDITVDDRTLWEDEIGEFGQYRNGDYNLDGDIEFNDRILWELNNGQFTSVPRD
jgi:uncharacterized repeat protein (TIGR01451 family)